MKFVLAHCCLKYKTYIGIRVHKKILNYVFIRNTVEKHIMYKYELIKPNIGYYLLVISYNL